jgi:hypothetical protein
MAMMVINKGHKASPQSAKMETQISTPMSELSVGLQSVNNKNKLNRVMPCLKLNSSHVTPLAFFYGSTALGFLIF